MTTISKRQRPRQVRACLDLSVDVDGDDVVARRCAQLVVGIGVIVNLDVSKRILWHWSCMVGVDDVNYLSRLTDRQSVRPGKRLLWAYN